MTQSTDNTTVSLKVEKEIMELASQVLTIESDAILSIRAKIGQDFISAVKLLFRCKGRVVISGMGKSGYIARKIAATMASTGTPSFFVHPAEASHGDLGMITPDDIVVALSNSGESDELLAIIPVLKRRGAVLIAVTGNPSSTLAESSNVHLYAGVEREACPLNLSPTASTTAALALGDALALCLLKLRGFRAEDFAMSHPGGSLGRRLLVRVSDVMHADQALPCVRSDTPLPKALLEMTRKKLGMTAVVADNGKLVGIYTDGDLRRSIEQGIDLQNVIISDVMHTNPITINANTLATEAVRIMESLKINGLLVVDDAGDLLGALNMHDLFQAKVI